MLDCQFNECDKENANSPLSKTGYFIKSLNLRATDKKVLKHTILEKNIIIASLQSTYHSSTCNQERRVLKKL